MRVTITLGEDLVRELDRRAGERGRDAYIAEIVRERLERVHHQRKVDTALGLASVEGNIWDPDVAQWVHDSRRPDPRGAG